MAASWRKRGALRLTLATLALAVLASPAAAAPPDQAPQHVTHRHSLEQYKVERHIDLEDTEYKQTEASCRGDDIATDGMWRIDHVDQDELGQQPLADIDVYEARSHPADPSKYLFSIYNNSEGRAQMKLYLTCLGHRTASGGHQHDWSLKSPLRSASYTRPLGQHAVSSPKHECGPDEIAVAPGYEWTKGYGELYKSSAHDDDVRGWQWGFFVTLADDVSNDADVTVSFRCLKGRSSSHASTPPHHHRIMRALRPGWPIPNTSIGAGLIETRTRSCGSHEKAMVHSFDLDPHLTGLNVWYLGMDPRIKKRAYKVKNPHGFAVDARFGAVCFNDRTSRKLLG